MYRSVVLSMLIFLFASTSFLTAQQNDSIKNEILNYPNSDLELISKGRALTTEHLKKGDLSALKEVKEFLANELGNPYNVYRATEYWLLSFWTEEYRLLLNEVKLFSNDIDIESGFWKMSERFSSSPLLEIISGSDNLSYELGVKSAESYIPLTVAIDAAELNNEEKDFLKMWLYSILFTPHNIQDKVEMTEVNNMADNFLNTYQTSEYSNYTRRFIQYRFKQSKWGIGYDFFLGYNSFTGGLSHHFGNNVAGGFALDILYYDFDLSLRLNYTSVNTTKKEITHQDITWPANSKGSLVGGDLALHYPVYQNKDIKIMPFIGIGGMGISPLDSEIKKYPELGDFKELSTLNYSVGLDLKLNSWDQNVDLSGTGGFYVGMRYTYYMPNYKQKFNLPGGNMHMITFTFGGFGRSTERYF